MKTEASSSSLRRLPAWSIVLGGAVSLAVAMGIGRFAFTPLLPMMIHDGVLNLSFGSTLASANYLGYLLGAVLCMGLPQLWSSATITRWGLVLTAVLTFAMLVSNQFSWIIVRFLAGIICSVVLVHTSKWTLALLTELRKSQLGSIMFVGVGLGITLSGFIVSAMVQWHWSSHTGWLSFGIIALVLVALTWRLFLTDEPNPVKNHPILTQQSDEKTNWYEMSLFSLAYGFAGFGYIITATYLPVIARDTLPASASFWLDLFWPAFGLAAVVGSIVATRLGRLKDPRLALTICYLMEGAGVIGAMIVPTVSGFFISSFLAGLPFNAINFFTMQEVMRLRPSQAARYMGLLTALFSIGQIAGPPMVNYILQSAPSAQYGFSLSLQIAAGFLFVGAVIFVLLSIIWPIVKKEPNDCQCNSDNA